MHAVRKDKTYETKSNFQNEPDPWGIKVPTDLNHFNYKNDITNKLNPNLEKQLHQRRLADDVVNTILNDIEISGDGIDSKFINQEYLTPFLANKDLNILESARESFYGPLLKQIQPLVNGKPGPIKDLYNALNKIEEHYKGIEKRYATTNVA